MIPPAGYSRIKVVHSFEALVNTTFGPEINAICWSRHLDGDFDELAAHFSGEDEIATLDEEALSALRPSLSARGQAAVDILLRDQRLLLEHGLAPSLECVPRYRRDNVATVVPTDVYSFHVDRATVPADTYLCSYNQAATEGLQNEFAERRIDNAATRAALMAQFESEGGGNFDAYLRENCYDLHYLALKAEAIFSFGIGNLWRIAVDYPGAPVPPCVHRAPEARAESPPRLLLIS